jgi:hypothetical protein
MVKFSGSQSGGVAVFTPTPDSQAAHDELLAHLVASGVGLIPIGVDFNLSHQGNLGEYIAYRIGRDILYPTFRVKDANASFPTNSISESSLDLLWISLGKTPDQDVAVVQEVKTSGDEDLSVADKLVADYKKLFSTDIRVTLGSRLKVFARKLKDMDPSLEPSLMDRIVALGGISPALCSQVRVAPTLVHDSQHAGPTKLAAVRTTIAAEGWPQTEAITIRLDDLVERLERISRGLP